MKGRYTEIERENRILLEKMSGIMQSNRPVLFNPGNFRQLMFLKVMNVKRSLNREVRKKELLKITIEN